MLQLRSIFSELKIMSSTKRLKRGFFRLGVFLAAPFLVAAFAAISVWVADRPTIVSSAPANYFDRFDPQISDAELLKRYNIGPLPPGFVLDRNSLPDKSLPSNAQRRLEPLYWAAASVTVALILFLTAWAAGWVLAGFARDDREAGKPSARPIGARTDEGGA
jgi:hypothetical protein